MRQYALIIHLQTTMSQQMSPVVAITVVLSVFFLSFRNLDAVVGNDIKLWEEKKRKERKIHKTCN